MSTIKFYSIFRPNGRYVFPHAHNSYEFVCYIGGAGTATVDGAIHHFASGDIAIIPPNTLHDDKYSADTTVFYCTFDPHDIIPCFKDFYTADELNSTRVPFLLEQISKERDETAVNHEKLMELLFTEILVELSRLGGSREITPAYPEKAVAYACEFFKDNFSRYIEISALAAQTGYSYDRFRHIFSKHVGCPPHKYLTEVRVQAAKKLCQNTHCKFVDIAKKCGFSSASKMIQAFKAHTGLTPSEYRAKHISRQKNLSL